MCIRDSCCRARRSSASTVVPVADESAGPTRLLAPRCGAPARARVRQCPCAPCVAGASPAHCLRFLVDPGS
eukprot:13746160-Alexandrium_andersonii.AAC.1